MPVTDSALPPSTRAPSWKWWACGLLLLATMLNYMDRVAFNQTADRIMDRFALDNEQYGRIEAAFAIAFALGALGSGWLVDRWNVFWVYPLAVIGWSAAGFVTGFARSYPELLLYRFLLGLFEAANWPCAMRTTQRILTSAERSMGNGILQSGASLGAICTPPIVLYFLYHYPDEGWRYSFFAIGAFGNLWVLLWLAVVRPRDLALPDWDKDAGAGKSLETSTGHCSLWGIYCDRRFWVLVLLVVTINSAWHFFRAWLPLFLKFEHQYGDSARQWFASAYYGAADVGSLAAGFVTLGLVHRGLGVHRSRVWVFFGFALLTTLSLVAAVLPTGPLLLAVLLVIGFGSLGVFPNYYTFSQELTQRHQGKLTGTLGCINWVAMAALQWTAGVVIDATKSYALGVAVAGLFPLVGWLGLVLFWGRQEDGKV